MVRKGLFFFFLTLNLCACGDENMITEDVIPNSIGLGEQPVPSNNAIIVTPGRNAGSGPKTLLLNFRGMNSDQPQLVTVVVRARADPSLILGLGPLRGEIAYSTGNGSQAVVEFDIPISLATVQVPGQGGVSVTVPAAALTVSATNFAAVFPRVGDAPLGATPQVILVSAFLGVGTRPTSNTVFLTDVLVNSVAGGLGIGASVDSVIPPFAKRARVLRAGPPDAVGTTVLNGQGITMDGPINVITNVQTSFIDLPGGASSVRVTNNGAAVINRVAVIYEMGI